jgi:hypothetical protein
VTILMTATLDSNYCATAAACRGALAAVVPYMCWLAELEEAKSSKQQQQQQQQTVEDNRECLLAIGSHINSLDASSGLSNHDLWTFVSQATGHSMVGEQLAHLHAAMQLREGRQPGQRTQVPTMPGKLSASALLL